MKTRIILLIAAILLVLGFAVMAGATSSGDNGTSSDNDNILLQDDADDSSGDEGTEDGDDSDSDDEEPSDEEPAEDESGEEEGTEEAPSEETPEGVGMGDFLATPGMEAPTVDTNLQDALGGYADYEVSYDTSVSHADNTPSELRALGEEYLERTDPASEAGKVALALADFDLLAVLENRYEKVEDEYAADPDEDFAPDDPDRDLNYFQPRFDPFVLTHLIPEELRPEMEGTGLDGAVDPELLEQLGEAVTEANLRWIPIQVIGTIQVGPMRACMYSLAGMRTRTIAVGDRPHNYGSFSIGCSQVSEDFVVLVLRSGSALVYRTFHISR
jgi:hypothetical protein